MKTITVSTDLPVAIDDAFAWLSDPENDPAWCGPVQFTELEDGQPGTVGATYRFAEGLGRQVALGTVEILELDPPRRMVTRTRTSQRDYTVIYELESTADGCRLTQMSEASFRGVPGPLMRPFLPLIRWQLKRQFRALRAVLSEDNG